MRLLRAPGVGVARVDGTPVAVGLGLRLSAEAWAASRASNSRIPDNVYTLRWLTNKRLLPMLLRGGSPLPRATHAQWMRELNEGYMRDTRKASAQYVAKVRAAGSWAAYEKAHIARLVPVFEKIFPRPRLPHEIASHVVRFCFHTGDY